MAAGDRSTQKSLADDVELNIHPAGVLTDFSARNDRRHNAPAVRRVQVMPQPRVAIGLPPGVFPEYMEKPEPPIIWFPAYRTRSSFGLGISHIFAGLCLITFQGAAIGLQAPFYRTGYGIWTGVMALVTGAFGLAASRESTRKMILVHLCLALSSTFTSLAGVTVSVLGIYHHDNSSSDNQAVSRLAMNAVLLVLCALEVGLCMGSTVISGIVCGPGESCVNCTCDECLGEAPQSLPQYFTYSTETNTDTKTADTATPRPVQPALVAIENGPGQAEDKPRTRLADIGYYNKAWSGRRPSQCDHAYRAAPNKTLYCVFCGIQYETKSKPVETKMWRY